MIISEIPQGTDEWKALRRGVPTASCFSKILTGSTLKTSASQRDYMNQLLAESLGLHEEGWQGNHHTIRGNDTEEEASAWYEIVNDVDVEVIGFTWKDERQRAGGSPDRLVGMDGGLEIKCPDAKGHIDNLRCGKVPTEHLPQLYGYLWLTDRQWWDFVSYNSAFTKQLQARINATDDDYQKWLKAWEPEIEKFCDQLDELKRMVATWFG